MVIIFDSNKIILLQSSTLNIQSSSFCPSVPNQRGTIISSRNTTIIVNISSFNSHCTLVVNNVIGWLIIILSFNCARSLNGQRSFVGNSRFPIIISISAAQCEAS